MTQVRCYIHASRWPYPRIAELTTAHNINRGFAQLQASPATVMISKHDPGVARETLMLENWLVIESPLTAPWVGRLLAINEAADGVFELVAKSWEDALSTATHTFFHLLNRGAGLIARDSLIAAYMDGANTGIRLPTTPDVGARVTSSTGFSGSGTQTVLSRLTELVSSVNEEWWLDVSVTPKRLEATLRWGQQGFDLRGTLHLWEGRDFSTIEHLEDLTGLEPSVAFVTDPRSIPQQSPGMSQGQNISRHRFTMKVNEVADWRLLNVGNIFTVHAVVGIHIAEDRHAVRITGTKPDEERGEMTLLNEVLE